MMNQVTCGALALAMAASLIAGCSSVPLAPTTAASAAGNAGSASAAGSAAGSSSSVGSSSAASTALPPYLDPKNPLYTQRSIYFDFDDFSIQPQYESVVARHAKYLITRPELKIKLEGNADERGSAEYNLALGQRRAEAVLKAMKIYGVRDAQMEAISWGKEHPKATGHDEASLAENRRVDIVYPRQ